MKEYTNKELEELTELWLQHHDPDYSNSHRNKAECPYLSKRQYKKRKLKECVSYKEEYRRNNYE